MIAGIGTDIVAVRRTAELFERHGRRALEKILAPSEIDACLAAAHPGRFLAKRFAAKEALGKALGTGIRAPVLLPAIAVEHDSLGRPHFAYTPELAAFIGPRTAHLSLSDEDDYTLAFVVVENPA